VPIYDYDTISNKTVQLYFNSKFVESLAHSYFQLTPTVLVQEDSVRIVEDPETYEMFNKYLPGVWSYFIGNDQTTSNKLNITAIHEFVPKADSSIYVDADLVGSLAYQLDGSYGYSLEVVFQTIVKLSAFVDIDSKTFPGEILVPAEIKDVQIGDIIIKDSFFGTYTSYFLTGFLNVYFDIMLSKINRDLRRRSEPLAALENGVKLVDPEIVFFDGFMEVGTDVLFEDEE